MWSRTPYNETTYEEAVKKFEEIVKKVGYKVGKRDLVKIVETLSMQSSYERWWRTIKPWLEFCKGQGATFSSDDVSGMRGWWGSHIEHKIQIINLRLDLGAPADKALSAALSTRDKKLINRVINLGAKPDEESVKLAIRTGNPRIVRKVVDMGAEVRPIDVKLAKKINPKMLYYLEPAKLRESLTRSLARDLVFQFACDQS